MIFLLLFFVISHWLVLIYNENYNSWNEHIFPPRISFKKKNFIRAVCALSVNLTSTNKEEFTKNTKEIYRFLYKKFPKEKFIKDYIVEALRFRLSMDSVCEWLKKHTDKFDEIEIVLLCIRILAADGLVTSKEQEKIDEIAHFFNVDKLEYQNFINYVNQSYSEKRKNENFVKTDSIVNALNYFGFQSVPTVKEIKVKFRKLVKEYHPDWNQEKDDIEKKKLELKFIELQKFYNQLLIHIG